MFEFFMKDSLNVKNFIKLSIFTLLASIFYGVSIWSIFYYNPKISYSVSPPVVDFVYLSDSSQGAVQASMNLIEDTQTPIYIYGKFTDNDGCADVRDNGNIDYTFYRSGISTTIDCSPNNSYCYKGSLTHGQCEILGCVDGSEPQVDYQCTVPVYYYADPTDEGVYSEQNWTAYLRVSDTTTYGSMTSSTEINSLTAAKVIGNLNYGILHFNEISPQTWVSIRNTGNVLADVNLSGEDMICSDIGSIPLYRQRFSITSGTLYADMAAVPTTTQFVQFNLGKSRDDFISSSSLYFRLSTPSVGLLGTCTGTTVITATLDQ